MGSLLRISALLPLLLAATTSQAEERHLFVAYPPAAHETTSASIFFIGTAAPTGEVQVNGKTIPRSPAGHFAPSFPLQMGANTFTLQHGEETLNLTVNRIAPHAEHTAKEAVANERDPTTPSEVIEVVAESGITRAGPSVDSNRLTPLPKGTLALVTGSEGDWLRLDYGAWIGRKEVEIRPGAAPPRTILTWAEAKDNGGWTDVRFSLQSPVAVDLDTTPPSITIIFHHATAQLAAIPLEDNPVATSLICLPIQPDRLQGRLLLKTDRLWGYKTHHEKGNFVLSLRHPPAAALDGVKILLDPGHGGPEDLGARGPTGLPEKDVTLAVAKLLQEELVKRGATASLTRDRDVAVPLNDRVAMIEKQEPTLFLSLHYNALPDSGDAWKTQGIGAFWFHPQARDLATFLQNHLAKTLARPSDGVYWKSLAVCRPTTALCVLMELGFIINPFEFEWVVDPKAQRELAAALADGVVEWLRQGK